MTTVGNCFVVMHFRGQLPNQNNTLFYIITKYFVLYRHYCFLTCKKDFEDSVAVHSDERKTTKIHALILQATCGDYERSSFSRHATRFSWSNEFSHSVAVQYSKLAGVKPSSAQYNCLKEFFCWRDFGYEYHSVKTDDNAVHSVAVGRGGLRFCDEHGSVIRRYTKFANF